MSDYDKTFAEIPPSRQEDGLRWLVILRNPNTGFCWLYSNVSPDESTYYDDWLMDRDEALEKAENRWGVKCSDWKPWTPEAPVH